MNFKNTWKRMFGLPTMPTEVLLPKPSKKKECDTCKYFTRDRIVATEKGAQNVSEWSVGEEIFSEWSGCYLFEKGGLGRKIVHKEDYCEDYKYGNFRDGGPN